MHKDPQKPTRESPLVFQNLFHIANDKFSRESPLSKDLRDHFSDAIVTSAISKCLDFNIVSNGELDNRMLPFFLVANSRSICEDLIYVSYLRGIDHELSNKISGEILRVKFLRSILAQTNFFAENNPQQPTVGSLLSTNEQRSKIDNADKILKESWKEAGFSSTPSIRQLSLRVGLKTTYQYIYHMSSNFVHFNPGHLLRQGWGPDDGPFLFLMKNFSDYHSDVCRFLGAVLFLGYCYSCPDQFDGDTREMAIRQITSVLQSNVRWPEIVTFEEMNDKFPNILVQAVMSMYRKEAVDPLPDILSELKSLQHQR